MEVLVKEEGQDRKGHWGPIGEGDGFLGVGGDAREAGGCKKHEEA
jgi:hypothetical protein